MNCKRCGSPLPSEGSLCKFCGAMIDGEQIEMRKSINDKKAAYNPELKSDRYGVDKTAIYDKTPEKENKVLGVVIVAGVILVILVFAILIYIAG